MDVFQLLKADHRKVSDLFRKIAETTDRAVKTRQRLRDQLKAELDLHARAEEAHFYPALRELAETRDRVPEAVREHDQVRRMLAQIEAMAPTEEGFLAKVKELEKAVKHHVREEEKEIFPAAKGPLGKERAREIAEKIEEMKAGGRRRPRAAA